MAYFRHLASLILFFFTKRQSREERTGGGGGQRPSFNTLLTALYLFREMIMIGKESTIAFSAIDKLVF